VTATDTGVGAATRERLMVAAERLFAEHGFAGVSLRAIIGDAQVNLAAIHYHYPGKEDLLAAIIDQYISRYEELDKQLSTPGITSRQKIETIINRYSNLCDQNKICIIGSVCSDYNTMPENVKTKLSQLIEMVLSMVEKVLQQGRRNGEFIFSETARTKSLMIMTNLAAGVQLARITGEKDYRAICKNLITQITP